MTSTTSYKTANFVAIAPNYFGRGFTVDQAKSNLKLAGGSLARYVVYRLPAGALDAWVDDFGSLRWEWVEGSDRTGTVEIVAKRGVK